MSPKIIDFTLILFWLYFSRHPFQSPDAGGNLMVSCHTIRLSNPENYGMTRILVFFILCLMSIPSLPTLGVYMNDIGSIIIPTTDHENDRLGNNIDDLY